MTGLLADRTVIVTGAGRGIGAAYATAMAREGARVVVNDVGTDLSGSGESPSPADHVARTICDAGGVAVSDHSDVSDSDAAGLLVARAVHEFGTLDALVNNAAVEHRGSIEEHPPAAWDRVLAVNARGSFNCVRHAAPVMRRQGRGAVVNTTSGAFWEGTAGVAAYAASKAAVFSLTLTQHTELHPHGITSNCIAPNATRTRMVESWIEHVTRTSRRTEADLVAEYGIQPPENLAPLAILLCSDAGSALSGHVFEVWNDRISLVAPPSRGPSLKRSGETWRVEDLARSLPKLVGS